MLTEQDYINAASILDVEVAVIKAVCEVESSGGGFLPSGEVKILFEPAVFWKELRKRGIDPNAHLEGNSDILYIKWGTKPYGKQSQQWGRLKRAAAINEEAAYASASYGLFQILGNNFKECGFNSVMEFVNYVSQGEDEQLNAFCTYIKSRNLDDELRLHLWKDYAEQYNGPLYWKQSYNKKLEKAYNKYK